MKLIVVVSAALGSELFSARARAPFWSQLAPREIDSFFPALTSPVQAALRTAAGVEVHGMGAGGYFDRTLKKVFYREQSSLLFSGPRIWEDFRARGGKVAQVCLQQSLGNDSDFYLLPAPIPKYSGGMVENFLSRPKDLYRQICEETDQEFSLARYWGPFTSVKASRWITAATGALAKRMADGESLILTYLPHLGYETQRDGPGSSDAEEAFEEYEECLEEILVMAKQEGYEVLILGDYEITDADRPLFPNRLLAEKGFLSLSEADDMLYPDFFSSRAFALAEHQICHVYVNDPADIPAVQSLFEAMPGVSCVIPRADAPEWDHPRCGELILEAEPGAWFAYHWWDDPDQAPDYASHIDIDNKPGFDPMEICWRIWPPLSVPLDCSLLKGTHGRQCRVMCASTFEMDSSVHSFTGAAGVLKEMLSQ